MQVLLHNYHRNTSEFAFSNLEPTHILAYTKISSKIVFDKQ